MATTIKVGQTLPLSIEFLDQDGKPMATAPVPDAAPAWAQTTPATESLTAAPDGMSASTVGVAAGGDTVHLNLSVGGQAFSATLDVTVEAVAPSQTLTSIGIVAGTPV
ncbi:MAG: hypothetical protein V4502_11085 [Pseudomonadota bacterium]